MPTSTVGLDEATRARLQRAFEQSFATEIAGTQTPGAVALVEVGDEGWVSSLGVADISSQEPMTPDRKFRIARFDADPMLPWTVDDTIDLLREHDADFAPGAEVAYSDSNYVLLGRILEEVTGRPIREVIEDRFSTARVDRSPTSPLTRTGCSARPQFTGVDVDYGYGLGVMKMKDMYGHDGGIVGFGVIVRRYPAEDATFVVLVNSGSNFDNASIDIFNALLGELFPEQVTLPTGR